MKSAKKVTVELPTDLLKRAQHITGEGITGTIRQGLKLVAAREAYRNLRKLRGKINLKLDLKALRED